MFAWKPANAGVANENVKKIVISIHDLMTVFFDCLNNSLVTLVTALLVAFYKFYVSFGLFA